MEDFTVREELPQYVYLVKVPGQWPVNAIAANDPLTDEPKTAYQVERACNIRNGKLGVEVPQSQQARVYLARLTNVVEVELVPSHTIGASLRPVRGAVAVKAEATDLPRKKERAQELGGWL